MISRTSIGFAHFKISRYVNARASFFKTKRRFSLTNALTGSFHGRKSSHWVHDFVEKLDNGDRKQLLQALNKCPRPTEEDDATGLSSRTLKYLIIANGIPFIGFGFLDNAVMIIAGEYIDMTFATVFSLSTMAAAGFGNLISDLCGITTVGYVERMGVKLGFVPPVLTSSQFQTRSVRWAVLFGRAAGITIGCLLGMLPLLWFDRSTGSHKLNAAPERFK